MLCSPSWGICDPAITSTSSVSPTKSRFGSPTVSCRWRHLTSETPRSLSTCCQPLEVRHFIVISLIDDSDTNRCRPGHPSSYPSRFWVKITKCHCCFVAKCIVAGRTGRNILWGKNLTSWGGPKGKFNVLVGCQGLWQNICMKRTEIRMKIFIWRRLNQVAFPFSFPEQQFVTKSPPCRHKHRRRHPDRLVSASRLPFRPWRQPQQRFPHYLPDGRPAHGRGGPVHRHPGEHSLSRAGEVLHLHHRDREWCGLPAAGAHGAGELRDDETHPRGGRRQHDAQRVRVRVLLHQSTLVCAVGKFIHRPLDYWSKFGLFASFHLQN